jgi:hypothetical protein
LLALTDIKTAINTLLINKFGYKVYGNEVKEGFDKPSFFVELLPNATNTENQNFTSNLLTVVITYFQDIHSYLDTDLNNIKVYDEIKALFMPKLLVKDRYLTVSDFRYEYTDTDFIQIYFNLNYFDTSGRVRDTEPVATEITINNI